MQQANIQQRSSPPLLLPHKPVTLVWRPKEVRQWVVGDDKKFKLLIRDKYFVIFV